MKQTENRLDKPGINNLNEDKKMALDLRDTTKFPRTATLAANAATMVEIKIPTSAGQISIGSTVDKVFIYAYDGLADGDTKPGSDVNAAFVIANNYLPLKVGRGTTRRESIFVAFDTSGSGKINVILEEL